MSWRDVRGWYEEPDDEPEPVEPELAECQCWWCGRSFLLPAADPDRFCSLECFGKWAEYRSGEPTAEGLLRPRPADSDDDIPF